MSYKKTMKSLESISLSKKEAWWVCKKCGHVRKGIISYEDDGYICPECLNSNIIVKNSVSARRSKANREKRLIKSSTLKPNEVTVKSSKAVWWIISPKTGKEIKTALVTLKK